MIKSIRLNKEIREAILNNIKTAWVEANPAPVFKSIIANDILINCVNEMYLARTKELRELIQATPRLSKAIALQAYSYFKSPTGTSTAAEFPDTEDGKHIYYIKSEIIQHNFENPDELKKSAPMRKAVKQFNEVKKKEQKFNKELNAWVTARNTYLEQCKQVIYAVNTTKQLLEVWEEVGKFIPDAYRNPSRIALPAINVKSLNAQLSK